MAFTVEDFEDLVKLLGQHPEWQARLRPVILGEELLRIPSRMDRVEAALERMEGILHALVERMDAFERRIEAVDSRGVVADARMNRIEGRLSTLEGGVLEGRFHADLHNWTRHLIRKPERVFGDDLESVAEASASGVLSDEDRDAVANLDSLVRGIDNETKAEVYLAIELSHTVNVDDVARASERAAILEKAGLRARAMVGGYRITDPAAVLSDELDVAVELRRLPA